uniref:NADH dehydrogenase subunit 6 n=1 Tax=Arctopsyche spinescens TaxID=2973067 RepID=UPI0022383278|nr:NADH dehydrogenase subunit 6 [Arctopsyche spinescens]UYO79367.1 NADH dehydrogenase subunit 6 [Arctopsyche spinescens]
MTQLITMTLIINNSIMMLSIKSPLPLGMFLMFQTLLICFNINLTINIYWISYILYLIMLGGLLILFMYMCSIASNEIMNMQMYLSIYLLLILIISLIIFMGNKLNLMDTSILNEIKMMTNENKIIINKIYNKLTLNISLMLIFYLLINLAMVTKLTNSYTGPLRSSK